MESGILQYKMTNSFEEGLIIRKKLDAKLAQIEHDLEKGSFPKQVTLLEFVPDTLIFGENKGTNYYRIEVTDENAQSNVMTSTLAMRNTSFSSLILKNESDSSLLSKITLP